MASDTAGGSPAERLPRAVIETGVPNLDLVLGGGLQRGATVMVIGAPGTGKTMLAQQIAFSLAARGENTLFFTGYSEPHDKLLAHSGSLSFFAEERIGEEIWLLNLTDLLAHGEAATEDAIVSAARQRRASLVVLDGFRSMRRFLPDDLSVAHFLYSLGTKLSMLGTTTLVVVEGDPYEPARYPELTVCDVILSLHHPRHGNRSRRLLEVIKLRGGVPLEGLHPFRLDRDGVTIYPRFEAVAGGTGREWVGGRVSVGVPALDALLDGGLTAGTTTLCVGNPGVGKTLLGLHFAAAGAKVGEPALVLGFMEDEAQLREKGRVFGLNLDAAEASGNLRLMVLPGWDLEADQLALLLREDIERRGVRRLVIDSAGEINRGIAEPERKADFMAALVTYLRAQGVTTYITLDLNTILGPTLELTDVPLSVVAENLLILRYAEYDGALHRLLSVLKTRFSSYDARLHEYGIVAGSGIAVGGAAPEASGLLTDLPQLFPTAHGESAALGEIT